MVLKKGSPNYEMLSFLLLVVALIFGISGFVAANSYIIDVSFLVPDSVYSTGERIEIKGSLFAKNYSDNGTIVQNTFALVNATINLTIRNSTSNVSSYNFTTDSLGQYYSRSDYFSTAPLVNAPSTAGDYVIRAVYIDPANTTWFSDVAIRVLNQTIDLLRVSTDKTAYNPSESIDILIESLRVSSDRIFYVTNVSANGSIRNSTSKSSITSFNCTTGNNGKCNTRVNAPATYGDYFIEINDFKAFSSFSVVPFSANVYMKDGLGKSLKNIFSLGEQASVEVSAFTNSSNEIYTFSGYISDSLGNVVKSINSTTLNINNSYINKFVFTVDSISFKYGTYFAKVTIAKQGDGSIDLVVPFEVKDWMISIAKKEVSSGFEYDYSAFVNKTLRFEAYPKYRVNGSVIPNINASSFLVNLTDKLNNNLASANVSWNSSCGKEGCYQFTLSSPSVIGQYIVSLSLSFGGDIQIARSVIYIIDTLVSAQSTNIDGDIKELFGTNEFIYLSLTSSNLSASINLSDAEIFIVTYMNGSDVTYSNVSSFSLVNASNNLSEWAWNSTSQRFKMDTPRAGGVYSIVILAQNRTASAIGRFIVNPYDICSATKNTPGQVSGGGLTGGNYYYVWQFKTTDTVYFELKVIQANNPLGKASVSNFSSGGNGSSQYGLGSACSVNTQSQQVVNNASVSVVRVLNTQNGAEYAINASQSVCVSIDTSGGYTCTVAPATRWDGGTYSVEMKITGQDGSSDIMFGLFEARAFYLYGYSNVWQNIPSNNITLTVRMYEAGRNWWSNYGSGGLAGTVTVEKIEYMGKEGEWIWPPVDSDYNVSKLNSTSITTGSGTISLLVNYTKKGGWDTGYYRVILKGVDSSGNVDYGYAWFTVKLWDTYGMPIDCASSTCNYKSYFNSRENITFYIKIGNAGAWNYYDSGAQSLGGNVSISVKKIQDCRRWPCKDLNSSDYTSGRIVVNASSPWYWGSGVNSTSNYLLKINKTDGKWGTGWFSVVLDVNGSETGYAWFNTIAFYVDARPTDLNGSNWRYNIKPSGSMYYNTTITRNYMGWNVAYNSTDYMNASIDDAVLRTWDYTNYQSKEYNYPEDINITLVNKTGITVSGNALLNLSYKNGSWPAGYYSGEIIMKNSDNETSMGWLWFSVQPFRVEASTNNYEVDSDACVNATLNIREPDWYANSVLYGNYSIISVYENVWSGSSNNVVTYTNYTNTSFNGTVSSLFCPNSGRWGGGSWGGYHYLNVLVKDNINNDSQTGWLSFRTISFKTSWSVSGGSDKRTNENVNVTVTLTKPVSGSSTTGNLSKLYQWRYDSSSYSSSLEEYNFTVYTNGSSACSSTSGSCFVNGTATVVIQAPTRGWRVGSNYLYSDWANNDGTTLQDYTGVYFNGLEAYNGWFDSVDSSGNWKNAFSYNDNVTLRLTVRNSSYSNVGVNIINIQYYSQSSGCYGDWCASYTTATWSFVSGGSGVDLTNGSGIIRIQAPSGGWTRGWYSVRASVSGSAGTATITSGSFQVKDLTAPNVTINSPALNGTITTQTFTLNATSSENAVCDIGAIDYGSFYNWYCQNLNASNGSSTSLVNACNYTYYGLSNSTLYQSEYIYRDSYSFYNHSYSEWKSFSGISTGGTSHTYTLNVSKWRNQHYGIRFSCYDEDYNYGIGYSAIRINYTA